MQHLLILLLGSSLYGINHCKMTEGTCDDHTENIFSSFVQHIYEIFLKTIGLNVRTDESKNGDCKNQKEKSLYKKYTEYAAQTIRSTMSEDSTLDDAVAFANIFRDSLGIYDDAIIDNNGFEYHPMQRKDPGKIGQVETLMLPDGRKITMKTLATRPPVFEIDNFLTDQECDVMIELANKGGLSKSGLFVDMKTIEKGNFSSLDRKSDSLILKPPKIDIEFLHTIHERISAITDIPVYVIKGSEPISIVKYNPGGYYHAHLDSSSNFDKTKPCCFQVACRGDNGKLIEGSDCCNLCRYASFLYYLNDVDTGGETAFPLADMTMSAFLERRSELPGWTNLTKHCYNSNIVVKPSKGKAIFWYNHYLDPRGYLGGADWRSHHGGCHVTAGIKWIATNWISIPMYRDRFTPGRYENITKSYENYSAKRI